MKTLHAFAASLLALGAVVVPQTARADSADANCEVRKDGDKQGGKSGPCTFGQRQGYVDIDLKNGDTISLSPANQANQYRDQKGNKVVRTMQGQDQVYKWPNRTITVRFGGDAAAAAPRPSQDALVAGTNYNATAEVPCITAANAPKGRCKAGVMRMAGGEATVELQTPDGGQRHIYFKNGRPDSSDANAPMKATRQGDTNIIRIGTVEVYEIPDAFVVGG